MAVISGRLALASPVTKLVSIKMSLVGANRKTQPQTVNLVGTYGTNADLVLVNPLPEVAANVCNLIADSGAQRRWWCRGSDAVSYKKDKNGVDAPDGIWLKALSAFIKLLRANNFGIAALNPTDVPGTRFARYTVSTILPIGVAGETAITLTAVPPAWAIGNAVRISGTDAKQLPGLNGVYTILAINGAAITVAYQCPANAAPVNQRGKVRLNVPLGISPFDVGKSGFAYNASHTTRAEGPNSRGARRAPRIRQLL